MRKSTVASILFLALLGLTRPCLAQVSEKDVQGLEEQEFGIESGKKVKAKPNGGDKAAPPLEDVQPEAEPEKVKQIEAEEFKIKLTKKSHSGRVLLFDDASENRPRPGKILLLKNGADDVAAIRVLKNYRGKFAGKIVLTFAQPQVDQEYRALKKLGEKMIALIREREKRGKDLDAAKTDEDLAKEVAPDDNELDRGIPLPKPKKKGAKPEGAPGPEGEKKPEPLFTKDGAELGADSIEVKDEDEPFTELSVNEELPLEQYRHILSLQYASMRSVDKDNNPATYSAIGARYGFNFWRMPMWKRKSFQDMFTLELGVFLYTITNQGFITTGEDSVTVMPIVGDLRYTLLIGENLSLYTYLGFVKNNVSQSDSTLSTKTAVLATTKAGFGVGAMLRIGPAWAVRLDVGTDLFGIGACLKF